MAWNRIRSIPGSLKNVFESVEVDFSKHAIKGVLKRGFVTERAEDLPSLVVSEKIVKTKSESAILKSIYDAAISFAGKIFMKTGVIQNQIRKFAKDLGFGDLSDDLAKLFDLAIANVKELRVPLENLAKRSPAGPISVEAILGGDGIEVSADNIKLIELRVSEAKRCAVEISNRIIEFLSPGDDDVGKGPRKRFREDDGEDIGERSAKRERPDPKK